MHTGRTVGPRAFFPPKMRGGSSRKRWANSFATNAMSKSGGRSIGLVWLVNRLPYLQVMQSGGRTPSRSARPGVIWLLPLLRTHREPVRLLPVPARPLSAPHTRPPRPPRDSKAQPVTFSPHPLPLPSLPAQIPAQVTLYQDRSGAAGQVSFCFLVS